MGTKSTTVYGIQADTSDVDAAAETVTNSTTIKVVDNTTVAEVNFTAAASISSSISTIKNSPAKTKSLQTQLSETVVADDASDEEKAAVVTALSGQIDTVINSIAEIDGVSEAVVNEITAALTTVQSSISDNPTKAELVTVAVLSEMASTVASSTEVTEEVITKGLETYETLKVISEVSEIDVLGDLDISALLKSMTGKGVSRDDEEEEGPEITPAVIQESVDSILEQICEDGKFSAAKYKSFIFQASAIKSSIDLLMQGYFAKGYNYLTEDLTVLSGKDLGLTIDDLVLYAVCTVFAELDKLGAGTVAPALQVFVDLNYGVLSDLENVGPGNDFKFPESEADQQKLETAVWYVDKNIDDVGLTSITKATSADERFSLAMEEIMNDAAAAFTGNGSTTIFEKDAPVVVRAFAGALVESGYAKILNLIKQGNNGSIAGLFADTKK